MCTLMLNLTREDFAYAYGTFWQLARDPIFALEAARKGRAGVNPRELYFLDVFLWLPGLKTRLPGEPEFLRCLQPSCLGRLTRKGYNSKPTARRVRGLHRDYFLLTNRLECNLPGCSKSCQGTDPGVVSQMSDALQASFPVFITPRAAIDKKLVSVMGACYATRFGPKPFSEMLSEMHHLDHAQREMIYLAFLLSSPTPQSSPEPFSAYNDKLRFSGSTPSVNYCKGVFVDWMRAHRAYHDRITSALPGRYLRGDHTFKLLKLMALLGGVPTHVGLYTVVNEYEEIRGQGLTLTKELSFVEGLYSGIAQSLHIHGHEATQLMWSDNARAERGFHEHCTPSLRDGVVHIQSDTYSRLPPLNPKFVYLAEADLIDTICYHILNRSPDSNLLIGISIEHNVQADGQGGVMDIPAHTGVDVICIVVPDNVYVFKISHLNSVAYAPPNLKALLSSDRVVKIGHQIHVALRRVARMWNLFTLQTQLAMRDSQQIIDLGRVAKTKGAVSDVKAGLSMLTGCVLGHSIAQTSTIRLSDWSLPQLTLDQQTLAAAKAYSGYRIWQTLMLDKSVGLPVYVPIPGTLVNIRGGGSRVVALGTVVEQPPLGSSISIRHGVEGGEKNINLTRTRILVQVDDIRIPGYEPALHKLSLEKMGPPPFQIVMTQSMVVTRNSEPPVEAPETANGGLGVPVDIATYDPLENVCAPGDLPEVLGPNDFNDPSMGLGHGDSDGVDADPGEDRDLEDSIQSPPVVPNPSNEEDEFGFMDGVEMAELMEAHEASTSSSTLDPLAQPKIPTPATLPTRTFEDIFHVKDRLLDLLPKGHSAFKPFAAALGLATFVYDRHDRAAVEASLKKTGETWNEAIRARTSAMHRRVRRYIPPPDILVSALTALFDGWKDIVCSINPTKNGQLFSEEARHQAENFLKSAQDGFLSDPPGYALYYKLGVDKDGLVCYRCVRGTNSVEGGVHMPLRRAFGSLRASPELTDVLLCNLRNRRNTKIGYMNRTGTKWKGHFNLWLSDEIVELAAEVGIRPSFPIPDILATRISTDECFGIIPVPKKMVHDLALNVIDPERVDSSQTAIVYHRGTPAHRLTRLSTTPISTYDYLAMRQRTQHPVVPIHTTAEFKLFNTLMKSGGFYKQPTLKQPLAS
ncbi:hypothetical protein C8R46DRAFT_1357190 [Mycena filopes]|nr:hypothetical protein C8R46DRAFT_1357190 [Mycena filopes]